MWIPARFAPPAKASRESGCCWRPLPIHESKRYGWIRRPTAFSEALHNTLNTNLYDAVIPGFALHWDLEDLVKAMGDRPVMWTDPTNWMGRVVPSGPRFRYRWVLGDLTEMSDTQDNEFAEDFLK